MAMIWRRLATRSANSRVCSSASGLALTLACRSEAGDHRRIDRVGLGTLAEGIGERTHLGRIDHGHRHAGRRKASTAASVSKPPVASSATTSRRKPGKPTASVSTPAASLLTKNASPDGTTCTSSRSFDTSIPTTIASIFSHPCLIGLRLRPRRLFGFDGTADGDPSSPTGSIAQQVGRSSVRHRNPHSYEIRQHVELQGAQPARPASLTEASCPDATERSSVSTRCRPPSCRLRRHIVPPLRAVGSIIPEIRSPRNPRPAAMPPPPAWLR